jgi:hypothetical protein
LSPIRRSSALSGFTAKRYRSLGWKAGLLVTFAQTPILLDSPDPEASIIFGLAILAALSVLPIIVAALTNRFTTKR